MRSPSTAFRGRELLFNVVLGGVLVPATALALPLFLLFSQVQLTNTFWAVFLPSIVSPFGVYLARVFAEASVPDELLEAARTRRRGGGADLLHGLDPAHAPRADHDLPVPVRGHLEQLLPAADHAAQRGAVPGHLGLYAWNSTINQFPELRSFVLIGALLSIIPLIVTFLLLQRYWRTGLGTGALK